MFGKIICSLRLPQFAVQQFVIAVKELKLTELQIKIRDYIGLLHGDTLGEVLGLIEYLTEAEAF